jgi:hypothetical protein
MIREQEEADRQPYQVDAGPATTASRHQYKCSTLRNLEGRNRSGARRFSRK